MLNFFMKQLLKKQLSALPPDQQEKVLKAFEENPDFFKTLAEDVKVRMDKGESQQEAVMSAMMGRQEELKKIFTQA